jgi:hypothetical protein
MLGRSELAHWTTVFGVADEQVRRDHVISHVLAALSSLEDEGMVFYGGTALARTHLHVFRLSEDVDLLVTPRKEWAARIEALLPRALRRHVGSAGWDPGPTGVPDRTSARLVAGGVSVQVQLVSLDAEQARWPVERRRLELRYADAPPAEMTVPTLATFAAMKTLAWADRHAPRDLVDLAALANLGACDHASAALVASMAGWRPMPALFSDLPDRTRLAWSTDLSHQMARPPDPDAALQTVRAAWAAATDPPSTARRRRPR